MAWWDDAPHGRWAVTAQLPGPPADAVAWAAVLGRPSELVAVASGRDITVWSLRGPADALEVILLGDGRQLRMLCSGAEHGILHASAVDPAADIALLRTASPRTQDRVRPGEFASTTTVFMNATLQAKKVAELTAAAAVHQLEFNDLGSWLAASNSEGQVQLWRPALDGTWNLLTSVQGRAGGEQLHLSG